MAEFWKTNKQKEEFLVKTWFDETYGKQKAKVSNYAQNQDILNSRSATFQEFTNYIKRKKTKKVSEYSLVLEPNQDAVKIVSFSNERIGDSSNFYDENIIKNNYKHLKNVSSNVKPVALFAGNIIGEEWTLAHFKKFFNEQVVNDNGDVENIRMFVGLQQRKKLLKKQIKKALETGAEVVLMKGPQEFNALNNKTSGVGLDIMQEIVDEINHPNLHYISEGTSVNVNFVKKNTNRKHLYNTIRLETNISTKSADPSGMSKYAKNYNGESHADVIIRTNGNFTATEYHDNIIYPSGNLVYQNVTKGKYPKNMVNSGNVFLLVPEASKDVTIILGDDKNLFEDPDFELENQIQYLKRQKEAWGKIIKDKIDQKLNDDTLIKY